MYGFTTLLPFLEPPISDPPPHPAISVTIANLNKKIKFESEKGIWKQF